jgi:hypothetical protein
MRRIFRFREAVIDKTRFTVRFDLALMRRHPLQRLDILDHDEAHEDRCASSDVWPAAFEFRRTACITLRVTF